MKQVFSNFLMPIVIIVIFLAKNAEGDSGGSTAPPDTGFDRVRMTPDSTGTAMLMNETIQADK